MARVSITSKIQGKEAAWLSFPSDGIIAAIEEIRINEPGLYRQLGSVPAIAALKEPTWRIRKLLEDEGVRDDPRYWTTRSNRFDRNLQLTVAEAITLGRVLTQVLQEGRISKLDERVIRYFASANELVNEERLKKWGTPGVQAKKPRLAPSINTGTRAICGVDKDQLGLRFHIYYLSQRQINDLRAVKQQIFWLYHPDKPKEICIEVLYLAIQEIESSELPLLWDVNDLEDLQRSQAEASTILAAGSRAPGSSTPMLDRSERPKFPNFLGDLEVRLLQQPQLTDGWEINAPVEPPPKPISVWHRQKPPIQGQ